MTSFDKVENTINNFILIVFIYYECSIEHINKIADGHDRTVVVLIKIIESTVRKQICISYRYIYFSKFVFKFKIGNEIHHGIVLNKQQF